MNEIEEIYRHYKYLYGYVYSLCRNKELAEDIVQDTFVQAIMKIKSFRNECRIEVWLCQIAKHLLASHFRKKDRQVSDQLEQIPDKEDFTTRLEDKDLAKRVVKVLHNLPEPYKEVFQLHVFAEVSLVEIGELFEKSVSWAGVTFYRAKLKIWEKLKEDGYE